MGRLCHQMDLFLHITMILVHFCLKVGTIVYVHQAKDDVIIIEGEVYSRTVRTSICELIVEGLKCEKCTKYRSVLRAMYSRQKKIASSDRTTTSSHVNYRYLSSTEKNQRMANLHAELAQQRRKVAALKERVKKLTEERGVTVDEQLNDDLHSIMSELTKEVESNYPEGSFQRIFWNQQLEANKVS